LRQGRIQPDDGNLFKPQQGLAQVDRTASVTVQLSIRGEDIARSIEWTSDKQLDVTARHSISVTILPGGIAIVELQAPR
jgi:hypothetical protein